MDWRKHRAKLMEDPEFKAEYEALGPAYQLAGLIIRERLKRGVSQTSLARKMHSGQPVVSRLENATTDPRLSTVQKLADALDTKITLAFRPSRDGSNRKR